MEASPTPLYVRGARGRRLSSCEGVQQGDPLGPAQVGSQRPQLDTGDVSAFFLFALALDSLVKEADRRLKETANGAVKGRAVSATDDFVVVLF